MFIDAETQYKKLNRMWKDYKKQKSELSQHERLIFLDLYVAKIKECKATLEVEEKAVNRIIDRIIRKYNGEMTFIDIARELDLTLSTIKSTYKTALKKIKRFVDNQVEIRETLKDGLNG